MPETVGVEEEYQIVDLATRGLRPRADRILPTAREDLGDEVQPELSLTEIEIGTPVCTTLDEVRAELVRLRSAVSAAAATEGCAIAAMGTHPFTQWLGQPVTPKERYLGIDAQFQQLAREQLICGCHVHVGVDDRDQAIRIMDRCRPWLATLLALGANSPFWQGVDTGYDSYRTQLFDRWPTTGTPMPFGTRAAYDQVVDDLVRVRAIEDASKLYWDVRPSTRFETLEFRVADVLGRVDEAVMMAGLVRALVRSGAVADRAGDEVEHPRPELIRIARWQAARYGLNGQLVDPLGCEPLAAADMVERLLSHCRDQLEDTGDWHEVATTARRVLAEGNGADRQRRAFAARGSFEDVVDAVVAETASGVGH